MAAAGKCVIRPHTHTHPSGLRKGKSLGKSFLTIDAREKGKRGDLVIRLGDFVGGDGQMIGDRTTREEIDFDFCDGEKGVSKFEVSIRESANGLWYLKLGVCCFYDFEFWKLSLLLNF